MAHAVSGSAYSAKGGNLKFADVVRERFRGPAFGQDFTTWLDEAQLLNLGGGCGASKIQRNEGLCM